MDRFGMELNSFYKKKGEDEVWTLVKVDKNHAHFEHSPLFQAPGSGPQGLKVLHADLKDWKKAIGKPPRLLTAQELQSLLPENNIALDLEATKAQAQTALVAHYKQEATGDGIAFAAGVHGAFANQTFCQRQAETVPSGHFVLCERGSSQGKHVHHARAHKPVPDHGTKGGFREM